MKKQIIEQKIKSKVEKELNQETDFHFRDILLMFSIIGGVIGTTIALGSNELAKSLSDNIINPMLELFFSHTIGHNFLKITVQNVTFNIDKFIYQVLNFGLILLAIY